MGRDYRGELRRRGIILPDNRGIRPEPDLLDDLSVIWEALDDHQKADFLAYANRTFVPKPDSVAHKARQEASEPSDGE